MTRALRALLLATALGSAALASARPSLAQPVGGVPAAEDLFQRAKTLMTSRDYAAACPLLAESYRLDPAGGTLQNLAVCYEEVGRVASAYLRFQELRAVSKTADPPRLDRVRLADEHIAKLTPRLSRVTVVVPPSLAASASVQINGVTYERPAWSSGILVDPAPVELVVTAPGKRPYRSQLRTPREGRSEEITVPLLEDLPAPAPDVAPRVPPVAEKEPPAPTHRTTGLVVGGLGLAALGAGAVFGILAIGANNAGKDKCSAATNPGAAPTNFEPASGRCYDDSAARDDANASKDEARTFATVATVLVPVGIVGLGIGAYLVLAPGDRTKSRARAAVRLTPSLGGMSLAGSF